MAFYLLCGEKEERVLGVWFVLSGMLCFFIAHLADKYMKIQVAEAAIYTGIFMIALAALF